MNWDDKKGADEGAAGNMEKWLGDSKPSNTNRSFIFYYGI